MDLMSVLAQILNPQGAQPNRLTQSPRMEEANYLTRPSAGPVMPSPMAQPQMAAQPFQAPQAPQQPAMAPSAPAPSGGGIGGFLSNLFGGGQNAGKNQTIQYLMQQGMDEGTATMYASNKQALQQYLLQRAQPQERPKPLEVNGRLVDPNTYEVLADFSDKENGAVAARPLAAHERAAWGIPENDSRPYTITPGKAPEPLQGSTTREQGADFKNEMDTRKEYEADPIIKDYKVVRSNYERVRTGVKIGTGAGDIAVVFGYMKMLDPTSVVRENEQATAENAGGVPAYIRNLYNKTIEGDRLPPQSRLEILQAADEVYAEVAGNVEESNRRYGDIAKQWQLDPSRIIMQPERYDPLDIPGMTPPPATGGLPLPPSGAPVGPSPAAPSLTAPTAPVAPISPQGGVRDWKEWLRTAPRGPK